MGICRKRFKYLTDEVAELTQDVLKGYDIHNIHILCLGDFFSGTIHESLTRTNDPDEVDVVFDLLDIFCGSVSSLLDNFDTIHIPGVVGNHPRMTKKVNHKQPHLSLDYMFLKFVESYFRNEKRVTVDVPKAWHHVHRVNEHNFLMLHGNFIRSWAGIPYYGIRREMQKFAMLSHARDRTVKKLMRLNKPELAERLMSKNLDYDYVCMGHFHVQMVSNELGSKLVMNSSFRGPSEFAMHGQYVSGEPSQILFGVHEKYGKTWSYDIDLSYAD
jgi:hypothetical protein